MQLFKKKSEQDEEYSGIKPNRQNLQRMDMIVDESAVRNRFVDGSGGNNNRDGNRKMIGANSCIDSTDSHVAANSTQHGHNFAAEPAEADELEIYWSSCQAKIKEKDSKNSNNIVVVTRTRPFTERERELKTPNCVRVINDEGSGQDQVWIVNPASPEAGPMKFSFDYCMDSFNPKSDSFVSQKVMFETVGLDLLSNVWTGYNSSIFAYGQTGSGKTYSIMGFDREKGIIPRVCETLFYFIDTYSSERQIAVEATYLEIYQEKIIDLLNPLANNSGPLKPKDRLKLESQRRKLMKDRTNASNMEKAREILRQLSPTYQGEGGKPKVREDPNRGVVVDNLKRFAVQNYNDCSDLLEEGLTNRTTAATAMNVASSRSHAVFTLELSDKDTDEHMDATAKALAGVTTTKKQQVTKITLIDLAGSERTNVSQTQGQSLKEGSAINKSLSVLGLVIQLLAKASKEDVAASLAEDINADGMAGSSPGKRSKKQKSSVGVVTSATGESRHIPFRDSVLTYILRDSLVGNSKTVMLAAISPAALNYYETVSTLRFANNAKMIKTKAVINEDPTQKLIRQLQEEVKMLRAQLKGRPDLQASWAAAREAGVVRGNPDSPENIMRLKESADGSGANWDFLSDDGTMICGGLYDPVEQISESNLGHSPGPHSDASKYQQDTEAERVAAAAMEREKLALQRLREEQHRRGAAEANMADLRMRLQHRRKVVRLHHITPEAADIARSNGKSGEGGAKEAVEREQRALPYLTFLSDDPALSSQLQLYVALGQRLRVGTAGAKMEQDVKIAGLGITPETAIFTMRRLSKDVKNLSTYSTRKKAPPSRKGKTGNGKQKTINGEVSSTSSTINNDGGVTEEGIGILSVCPASPNAQVRVNGTLIEYKTGTKPGGGGDVILNVGDRIVLGTCAHVLLVCFNGTGFSDSQYSARVPSGSATNNYEKAIREVVLQRVETKDEYGRRLAGLVVNKLRLPRARAVLSATLVRALRGVFEGNEVAVAMGSNKRFKVHCGGVVDNDHLFSLRIEDILPMQRIRVTIQVFMHTHEYRTVLQKSPNLTPDNRNVHVHSPLHSTSSTGTLDNRQEPWGTCELDEFLDMVEDLKATLQSCRAVAESVVTPTSTTSLHNDSGKIHASDNGASSALGGMASTAVAAAMKNGRGAGAITRAFFMAADADGDGVINREELVEAASALGLTPSETEMDNLFRQYDVESNDELSLGEFDQFVRDQLCARFDAVLASMKDRKRHSDHRSRAEIGAHLKQHLDALQSQMQLAVRMKEFDIALELEGNVRHVQDELAAFKAEQAMLNGTEEMQHAELLRMKEEALHYSADLRRALMDLADSHAALLMGLEPLMDVGRGADADEVEGIAAASYTASRVGEAASQVAHDLQILVQGNAAEDAARDNLAEAAAAALISGRTISANAKRALEERVARNSGLFESGSTGSGDAEVLTETNKRQFTPDDEVLFRDVSHHRNIVSRLVGTSSTISRIVDEEPQYIGAVSENHNQADTSADTRVEKENETY